MKTQSERLRYLLDYLISEEEQDSALTIPNDEEQQKRLLRALMNVRAPKKISSAFLEIQDAYLQEETRRKGIVSIDETEAIGNGIRLWQGDITRLQVDGIVNAANSGMLGCFYPCHGCIDNAIHTYAGVQLRAACDEIMRRQGTPEETGGAKLTPAYNLPSRFVLHTVGPIITGEPTRTDRELLRSCYGSCLRLAEENKLRSIAFCCISTGEFRFPNEEAAVIAIDAVRSYKEKQESEIEVIFNVYKDDDYNIYRRLLR